MGVGVALTSLMVGGGGTTAALPLFACLSATHLLCVHQSLAAVELRTLSVSRLRLACRPALEQLRAAAPLGAGTTATAALPPLRVLSPAEVARLEPVLPWVAPAAPLSAAATAGESVHVATGTQIAHLPGFAAAWRSQGGTALSGGAKHVIVVDRQELSPISDKLWPQRPLQQACDGQAPTHTSDQRGGFLKASVHVLFALDATPHDVLHGALHAVLTAELISPTRVAAAVTAEADAEAVCTAGTIAGRAARGLCEALEHAGWWVGVPVLAAEVGGRIPVSAAGTPATL